VNATPLRHRFSGRPESEGDKVSVYFADSDPACASLEQPWTYLRSASVISIVSGVLFGTMFTIAIFNKAFSGFIRNCTSEFIAILK